MFVVLAGLGFYAFNVPEMNAQVMPYWLLLLTGTLFTISAVIIKTVKPDIPFPGTAVFEKPLFDIGDFNFLYVVVPILVGLFLLASVGGHTQASLFGAPTFQAIEITSDVKGIITFFAANAEDIFFSGFMTPLIFGVAYYMLKDRLGRPNTEIVSALITLILSPLIFMFYHFLRYGFTDVVSSTNVFVLGLIFCLWVLLTRNLIGPLAIHAGNNLGKFFYDAGLGSYASLMGWILILVVIVVTVFWYLRKREDKSKVSWPP